LEARNAEQFHRNFAGHPKVRVPKPYWSYSSPRVLTLEFLEGTKLSQLDLSKYTVEERRQLAYRVAETWMTMIFRHGFFHGDPHPANVMVVEATGQIGLVDFGSAGKLSADDHAKLTGLFIDAAAENIDALPRRLAALGVRYPRELEEEFTAELRDVYYRYYGARLSEIDPIQLIREAFALIYRMHLQLPARFVLLDKAIATIGTVGVELYPDFNVFEVAKPYARDLMLERFTPRRVALRAQQEARNYARMAFELPYQVHGVLEELRDGDIEIQFRHRGLDELAHRLDLVFNRLVIAVIAMGGVLGSALIGIFAEAGPHLLGLHVVSIAGFGLSALLGIWLVWGVIRSGRL
jgi:ubiquinone biosynthesis protein